MLAHHAAHPPSLWCASLSAHVPAQEHEQGAHSMRQQLREQHEAVRALQGLLAAFQQEQQQSAEVRVTLSIKQSLATHIPHCPSAVQSTFFQKCVHAVFLFFCL